MSGYNFPTYFEQDANGYILEIEYIKGGVMPSAATVADLETYQTTTPTGSSNQVLDKAMLVYVEGGNDAAGNSATGWWHYNSTLAGGVTVNENWGWNRLLPPDNDTHIVIREQAGDNTVTNLASSLGTTVQFNGGAAIAPPAFVNDSGAVFEMEIALDHSGLTNFAIPLFDASATFDDDGDANTDEVADPKNFKFIDSGLSYDAATGYTFAGTAGNEDNVIINGNLTVSGSLTSASTSSTTTLETGDSFIRIGDPASFTQAGADQSEYHNAVDCGLVVNTGYYDPDSGDAGNDPSYSRHQILLWDTTFREWMLREGNPNGGAVTASDRFDAAEIDANMINGSNHFIKNFYVSAKELHFGLDTIFSFDHETTSQNPSVVAAGGVEFMKTRYVPTIESLRTFEPFFNPNANEDSHYQDYSWTDAVGADDNVANQLADTFVRYARVVKAKVDLEGGDVQSAGTGFKKIQVYHGGIFGANEIPMVKVYTVQDVSTEGNTGAVYEEIMVNVTQAFGDPYVEIVFNEGYLTTTDGQAGNILHVRMVG